MDAEFFDVDDLWRKEKARLRRDFDELNNR